MLKKPFNKNKKLHSSSSLKLSCKFIQQEKKRSRLVGKLVMLIIKVSLLNDPSIFNWGAQCFVLYATCRYTNLLLLILKMFPPNCMTTTPNNALLKCTHSPGKKRKLISGVGHLHISVVIKTRFQHILILII